MSSWNWKKTLVRGCECYVELEIYVEGYRPGKDQWLYSMEQFDSLEEALSRYDELHQYPCPYKFHEYNSYGITLENVKVFDYCDGCVYEWTREYE